MGDTALRVENLGKMYRIGGPQERYQTFRDVVSRTASAPFRRARDLMRGQAYGAAGLKEEIWALKDLSFEVKHGEVVGIIGRNGAGKSTLLKILSRITEPTTGYVDIYGRVGALLEVGTGFHPELTGRENIFLNGAILGMSREEIRRKFDEIVSFAGVEKFIDTPVKHYSSGMGLRLGFAVAAHLEPEILIVDEVLAVGDAEFQKKSMGKMSEVAGQGRTVLFVSHNMAAVQAMCTRSVLLSSGSIVQSGNSDEVVAQYLQRFRATASSYTAARESNKAAQIKRIRLLNENNEDVENLLTSQGFDVEITYRANTPDLILNLSISVFSSNEVYVLASPSITDPNWHLKPHPPGEYVARCHFPPTMFNRGQYTFSALLVQNGSYVIEQLDNIVKLDFSDDSSQLGGYFGYWGGVVRPMLDWDIEKT